MIQGKLSGALPLQRQLQLLSLPKAKQRRVLAQVGRECQKMTRANIRTQKDIHGKPFAKRSEKAKAAKQRRRLLRKMGKQLTQTATAREVTVGFKGMAGHIAAKHHYGEKRRVSAAGFKREMKKREGGKAYYDHPATKQQARTLVKQLGYKRPTASGQPVRVSQRWIRHNMTIGQAGAIIARLREAQGQAPTANQSWVVETPARAFFGATSQAVNSMVADILTQATLRQLPA